MSFQMNVLLLLVVAFSTTNAGPATSAVDIKVFSLNIYGNSWFDDQIDPKTTTYDYQKVLEQNMKYLSETYPNQGLLLGLKALGPAILPVTNPATKKKERLEALCDHFKQNFYDIVYLQEVWYKKDYDFLTNCLSSAMYYFSKFDPKCGTENEQSPLGCSGLMTMAKHELKSEEWVDLPKGDDFSSLDPKDPASYLRYAQYSVTRKALFHTIEINKIKVEAINTHMTGSFAAEEPTTRILRGKQASKIIKTFRKRNTGLTILAADANDSQYWLDKNVKCAEGKRGDDCREDGGKWKPTPALNRFGRNGFINLFHYAFVSPVTHNHPDNNQKSAASKPETLSYLLVNDGKWNYETDGLISLKKMAVEDLKTTKGTSFSDSQALIATLEIMKVE